MASRKSRKQPVNWVPWNEALAVISIVGDRRIVDAAVGIDASFWLTSSKIDSLSVTDDEWFALRENIEALRLGFINISRCQAVGCLASGNGSAVWSALGVQRRAKHESGRAILPVESTTSLAG